MISLNIAIIILTLFIIYISQDIKKSLRINSIITIISGYLIILSSTIINNIINSKIKYINITKITSHISNKVINRGLYLILFGAIQVIIYTIYNIYRTNKKRRINK